MCKQYTQHSRDEWLKEAKYKNWLQKVEGDKRSLLKTVTISLPMVQISITVNIRGWWQQLVQRTASIPIRGWVSKSRMAGGLCRV